MSVYLPIVIILPVISFLICTLPFLSIIRANKLYVLLIGVFCLIFFNQFIFGDFTINQKDASLLQIPFFGNYRTSIINYHQLPLWNPYPYGGMVNIAHPQSYLIHPLLPLFLLLPVFKAFTYMLILEFFLAAIFMFIFMKILGQKSEIALISGIIYAFNSWTVSRISPGAGVEYIYSYAIIPLSFCLLLFSLKSKKPYLFAALFGVSLSFIINGNPATIFYALIIFTCFILFSTVESLIKKNYYRVIKLPGIFLIGCVAFFLFNAIELLPLLEFQEYTAGRLTMVVVGGWRMQEIKLHELPDLLLSEVNVCFACATRIGFLGIVLVFLSLLPSRESKREYMLFFWTLIVVGILLMTQSPLFHLLREFIPFFNRIALIPGVFILFLFPFSVLAGFGASNLFFEKKKSILILLVVVIFAEALINFNIFDRKIPHFSYCDALQDFPHLEYLSQKNDSYRISCKSFQHPMEYYTLCPDYAVIHYGLRLINGDQYLNPFEYFEQLYQCSDSGIQTQIENLGNVKYILSPEPTNRSDLGLLNVINWSSSQYNKERIVGSWTKKYSDDAGWDRIIYVYENANALDYAFLVPNSVLFVGDGNTNKKTILKLLCDYGIDFGKVILMDMESGDLSPHQMNLLQKFNFIIVTDNKLLENELIQEYDKKYGDVISYNMILDGKYNLSYMILNNKTDSFSTLKFSPNEIILKGNATFDGFLFLSEVYYPGWQARVDGIENKIFKVDHSFRGIYLTKGEHVIEFYYDPPTFKIGFWITTITLILLITILSREYGGAKILPIAGFTVIVVFSLWWIFGYAPTVESTADVMMSTRGLEIATTTNIPIKYVDDTWVSKSSPDDNYGNDLTLSHRHTVDGSRYILLRFYLDKIDKDLDDNVTITSAKLRLYMRGTEHKRDIDVGAYKIIGDWGEKNVTWNTRPDFNETPVDIESIGDDVGWKEWDITSLVQESLASGELNILIKDTSYSRSVMNFYSSEYHDPNLWPKLVIS